MALETVLGVGSILGSVFGSVFGAAGNAANNRAARQAAKDQYEQAQELYEFDWDSTLRKYEYAQTAVDLQRQTADNVHQYKTELAAQSWQQAMEMREYEYKNAVDVFNRSEDQYEDQMAINGISAFLAEEEASRSLDEARLSNTFQQEGLARDLAQALDTSAFVKADLQLQRNKAISGAESQRSKNELDYQMKSVESSFQAQDSMVKSLLGEGQARSRGTGRSTGKAVQSILAAAGRQQAQISQGMANADQLFRIQATSIDEQMINAINQTNLVSSRTDMETDYKRQQYNQSLRELQASFESAQSQFSSTMMKIDRDRQAADLNAHYNRMLEPTIGPEIPRPIELPKSIFLDPLKPIKPPEPREQAPQTISGMTTFANAAAGIGNAIGTVGQVGKMAGWFN